MMWGSRTAKAKWPKGPPAAKLIASIGKIGFESWQVALVLMQICSIFLVKISNNELKNEEL